MRALPDRIAFGPSAGLRPPGRHGAALAIGIALVMCVVLVVALIHLLTGRSAPSPEVASAITTPGPSTPVAEPSPSLTAVPGDPDDAGVPSKESVQAAASFVDAWLTKDSTQRLGRLKDLTVSTLYEGLTYTDPAEIPTARRIGAPRVEDAGSYLVRYRVTLSNRSQVLVSTVYDGTRWLVGSIEPAVG